jgi:hypothetical protein
MDVCHCGIRNINWPTLFASTLPKPHEPTQYQSFVKELAKPAQLAHRALGFANPQKQNKFVLRG